MRFVFLIHGDAEAEAALTPAERRAIVDEHMAYGAMLRERRSARRSPATRRRCGREGSRS